MDAISGPVTISGSLKDVSVSDVLQFIHLGHRSGTLVLEQGSQQATLRFHAGRLVRAAAPQTPRLGDLLAASGKLTQTDLLHAIAAQTQPGEARSLGAILVESGVISAPDLRELVSQQISQAVAEVVHWENGGFAFVVDDEAPVDDIAISPSDVLPDSDLNIQMVLLEAARLFDEKDRREETQPALQIAPVAPSVAETPAPPAPRRVQVVSNEPDLALRLRIELAGEGFSVEAVDLARVGGVPAAESAPVVVLDLQHGPTLADLADLVARAPRMPVLALTAPQTPIGDVYGAGAHAAVPASEYSALAACVRRISGSARPASTAPPPAARQEVERLRRVFSELRSGMVSATVALNLMRIISESFERAVLFLVRRDQLTAIGAFGDDAEGRPLATLTRNLRLPCDEVEVFRAALGGGEAQRSAFVPENLPKALREKLGPPKRPEFVLFPVMGVQRPIALVYADHGDVEVGEESIEMLELAAAQVGIAFENELLRRQVPPEK